MYLIFLIVINALHALHGKIASPWIEMPLQSNLIVLYLGSLFVTPIKKMNFQIIIWDTFYPRSDFDDGYDDFKMGG